MARIHEVAGKGDTAEISKLLNAGADVNIRNDWSITPLHLAAEAGQTPAVKLLIESGAHLDARENDAGYTPLHEAVDKGHAETVAVLLENGADVNKKSKCGDTPLHVAVVGGYAAIAKQLLEHGADIRAEGRLNQTPLQLAVINDHPETVEILLEKGAGPLSLHQAAGLGRDKDVLRLLESGADINAPDACHRTPLLWAVEKSRLTTARLLVEKGAGVNEKDVIGRFPLYLAANTGQAETVKLLITKGADLNARFTLYPAVKKMFVSSAFDNGSTPLHQAAGKGHLETVRIMLDNGADVKVTDEDGSTPLHKAVGGHRFEVAELLINYNADVNAKNVKGSTPLHKAVEMNNVKLTSLLFEKGADLHAENVKGVIPEFKGMEDLSRHNRAGMFLYKKRTGDLNQQMCNAVCGGDIRKVEALLEKGAEVNANSHGLLHDAVDKGRWNSSRSWKSQQGHLAIVRILLERGVNVNARDTHGRSSLHIAAGKCYPETLRLLLEHGADVNAEDKDGRTPLHVAVLTGALMQGAGFRGTTDWGRIKSSMLAETIVFGPGELDDFFCPYPVYDGLKETIKILLEHGAEVNARDKHGRTPDGHPEITSLLRSQGGVE